MLPDSEETRMIFEPDLRYLARWREETMNGGEMADVVYLARRQSMEVYLRFS